MSELPRIVPDTAFELEEATPSPTGAPGSIIERLRARAAASQRARTLDLAVPGYRGELLVRFQPLDVAAVEHFMSRNMEARTAAGGISETIDAMVRACVAVYAMDNGDLVPVEDERGPVRLEHRLAVLLALAEPEPVLTAREIV